ncbi:MAG: chromate transporter [Candidatus Omnitrophota bacterium]
MMIYWLLALSFMKIGLLGFGGGYAMIALIQHEVVKFGISGLEFIDILALSQITPGSIGINASTYTGYKVAGLIGSCVATFSNIFPTFILMLLFARLYYAVRKNHIIETVFRSLRPLFIGLIAASILVMARDIRIWEDYKAILIFAGSFFLLYKFRVNPILMIILAGTAGLVIY